MLQSLLRQPPKLPICLGNCKMGMSGTGMLGPVHKLDQSGPDDEHMDGIVIVFCVEES